MKENCFEKTHESHYFSISTGYREFIFSEKHPCAVNMIFYTSDGFNLLTRTLKIENQSQYPVIFKQPSIKDDQKESALQNLLLRLVFSDKSKNLVYEDMDGNQKDIISLNGTVQIEELQ